MRVLPWRAAKLVDGSLVLEYKHIFILVGDGNEGFMMMIELRGLQRLGSAENTSTWEGHSLCDDLVPGGDPRIPEAPSVLTSANLQDRASVATGTESALLPDS